MWFVFVCVCVCVCVFVEREEFDTEIYSQLFDLVIVICAHLHDTFLGLQ